MGIKFETVELVDVTAFETPCKQIVLTYSVRAHNLSGDEVGLMFTLDEASEPGEYDLTIETTNGDWAGPITMLAATREGIERGLMPWCKENGATLVGE